MTYVERVAAYFRERPNQDIDGLELATVGGAYAWRTRVSDCRKLGMVIESRILTKPNGVKQSLYRYVPAKEQAA